MAELERKDLVSDDALKAPAILTKEFEKLLDVVNKVKNVTKDLGTQITSADSTAKVAKSTQQLTTEEKELIKVQNQISSALAKTSQEYQDYKKGLEDINKATKEGQVLGDKKAAQVTKENSSLKQLETALEKNRAAYANLRNEETRKSEQGKKLLSVIQEQDKGVNELRKSIGKFTEESHNSEHAVETLKDRIKEAGNEFGGAGNKASSLISSFKELATSRVAAALGLIGLAVIGVTKSINAYFETTVSGHEFIARLEGTIEGYQGYLTKRLAEVGKAIVNSGVVDLLKQAFEYNLPIDVKIHGIVGDALAQKEIEHLKEVNKATVENAKLELENNELLEKSRQHLLYSEEQRLEFLKQAKEDRNKILETNIELAEKEKEHLIAVARLESDEPRIGKALAEAEAKILQLRSDYLSGNRRIDGQINTLEQEGLKRRLDAARLTEDAETRSGNAIIEAKEHRAEESLKLDERAGKETALLEYELGELRLRALEKAKEKEITEVKRATQDKLIAEGGQDISDKAIEELKTFQAQKANIEKEYADKEIQTAKENQIRYQNAVLEDYTKSLAKRKLTLLEGQKELVAIDTAYVNGEIKLYGDYARIKREAEIKVARESADFALKALQEELELRKAQGLVTIEQERQIQETILNIKDNANRRDIEGKRKTQDAIAQLEQQAFVTAQTIIGNQYDRQEEKLKESIDDRVAKLEHAKDVEIIIAGDNAAAKVSIEEKYKDKEAAVQAEQNALQRKRAAAEQKLAAFEIFIRTSAAVLKAYAEVPFPYDSVVAGAYASIGALQLAAVLTKPLPAFELGTDFAPGGLALVGEKGRERVTEPGGNTFYTPDRPTIMPIKRGSVVIPYEETVRELALSALQGVSNDQSFQPNTDGRIVKKLADIEYAIANKSTPIVNITREGLRLMVQKANERIIFLDQFYK